MSAVRLQGDYYEAILERLDRVPNPGRFEECACALLIDAIPTLSPVAGGSDDGADGTFVDSGRQGILVATTTRDVLGNLTRSLSQWLEKNHDPCLVAIATSQPLSQRRIKNLQKRVAEKGFSWFNHYDRHAFANLLSKSPLWCQRLLELSGRPRALSKEPPSLRAPVELDLVGRDEDVKWLRVRSGDAILVGEPGSGKSYLLRGLAHEGWGWFVVDRDLERISNDVRELEPTRLIVDDAQLEPGFLARLIHLRSDARMRFDVVATTWPGDLRAVRDRLALDSPDSIRRLEPLNRDQIVAILRSGGLPEDREVLSRLTDLALGKPGLAATIIQLWRSQRPGGLLSVEGIVDRLFGGLSDLLGDPRANEVLSCIALGGRAGMDLESVASFLHLDLAEAHFLVRNLAAAGVLRDLGTGRLAVVPADLRGVRVKEAFLTRTGADLDFRPILEKAPEFDSALLALLYGRALGGRLTNEEMTELIRRSRSRQVWSLFASLGPHEGRWAIENYPGSSSDIAQAALRTAPEDCVRALLRSDSESELDRSDQSRERHPIRYWLTGKSKGTEEALERRRVVVKTSLDGLRRGSPRFVVRRYVFWAMSPALDFSESDPGIGRTITLHRGALDSSTVAEFQRLWDSIAGALKPFRIDDWMDLEEALRHWVYPEMDSPGHLLTDAEKSQKVALARAIVERLASAFEWSPGLASAIIEYGRKTGAIVPVQADPEFERIYPDDDCWHEDHERKEKEGREEVVKLAGFWARFSPDEALAKLDRFASEAKTIHRTWPDFSPALVDAIAAMSGNAREWWDAIRRGGYSAAWAFPFLRRMSTSREDKDTIALRQALGDNRYSRAAVAALLPFGPPDEELDRLLDAACAEEPDLVETAVLRNEVPSPRLRRLLDSKSDGAALAAAIGLLSRKSMPPGTHSELAAAAKSAIVRGGLGALSLSGPRSFIRYGLVEVLRADKVLALEWLEHHLDDLAIYSEEKHLDERDVEKVIARLDDTQRVALVRRLPGATNVHDFVGHLVAGDPGTLGELLSRQDLRQVHLAPLSMHLGPLSPELPALALDAGYSPQDVASALTHNRVWSGWGKGSFERELQQTVQALESSSDPRLNEVARHAREIARSVDELFASMDREAEIFGSENT